MRCREARRRLPLLHVARVRLADNLAVALEPLGGHLEGAHVVLDADHALVVLEEGFVAHMPAVLPEPAARSSGSPAILECGREGVNVRRPQRPTSTQSPVATASRAASSRLDAEADRRRHTQHARVRDKWLCDEVGGEVLRRAKPVREPTPRGERIDHRGEVQRCSQAEARVEGRG